MTTSHPIEGTKTGRMSTSIAGSRWAKDQDFHPTLSSVREEIERRCVAAGAVLASEGLGELVPSFNGVPYGSTYRGNVALAALKGKATTKWAHSSIYRLESGTYELTFYIL